MESWLDHIPEFVLGQKSVVILRTSVDPSNLGSAMADLTLVGSVRIEQAGHRYVGTCCAASLSRQESVQRSRWRARAQHGGQARERNEALRSVRHVEQAGEEGLPDVVVDKLEVLGQDLKRDNLYLTG